MWIKLDIIIELGNTIVYINRFATVYSMCADKVVITYTFCNDINNHVGEICYIAY